VEEWHILYSCEAAFWTQEMSPRLPDVNPLVTALSVVAIGNALTCGFSGNVPLLHMSTQRLAMSLHVISFTRPSPTLVLQAANAGVRRPGYEASTEGGSV